jgi:hypothetical protein
MSTKLLKRVAATSAAFIAIGSAGAMGLSTAAGAATVRPAAAHTGLVVAPLSAQAASHQSGVRPDVASQATGVVRVQHNAPLTFTVCDGSVCTTLNGGGLQVNSWSTWASNRTNVCTRAHWLVNDQEIKVTGKQCGSSNFRQTWLINRQFENGDLLCNTWEGFRGQSCVTVSLND